MAGETCILLVLNFKASHIHLLSKEGDPAGSGFVSVSFSHRPGEVFLSGDRFASSIGGPLDYNMSEVLESHTPLEIPSFLRRKATILGEGWLGTQQKHPREALGMVGPAEG